MSVIRKKYSPQEKAKIALEALKGIHTQAELTAKYGIHATQITKWKKELQDRIGDIFSGRKKQVDRDKDKYIEELHQQIGQLTIELQWLKKNLNCSVNEKRQIVESDHKGVSVRRQCQLIGLNRSNFYYQLQPVASEEDLELMQLIDEEYTRYPFYGTRKMARYLSDLGYKVNRKRVQRLYRIMGIQAVYPKRNLSKRNPVHKVYPYLLRGLHINRSNQVWCIDITYVRLEKGFAYLAAIMDWHSRYVLSWALSPTLEGGFCVELLKETILQYGAPEIFNSDQGSQFTSPKFTKVLQGNGVKISMDGKGRALDNVFIERLWRSVKYECIYLRSMEGMQHARELLTEYISFYNEERYHQGLNYKTPAVIYKAQKAA